ncbi:stage V sporulation protein AD [Clostridia bacterium]|nr:stage V sporulation protein AD [Clostridia bacterium]
MTKKIGAQTIVFPSRPSVLGEASVVGSKEGKGPLSAKFDTIYDDPLIGEKSWERAESLMQKEALRRAADKSGTAISSVDCVFAGDLLNQCIGSTFGLIDFARPFFGLYGACSTMAEGLLLASMAIDGDFAAKAAAVTSSHFCSAERQYRLPLDYGGQRPPTAQWTVTGSGAVILSEDGGGVRVTHATPGIVVDAGIKDAANMGAAMAPAAYETITAYLKDSGNLRVDTIVTGDLGAVGRQLLEDLLKRDGVEFPPITDCGELIFDRKKQDAHAGGSGCGCSAAVLCAHFIPMLRGGTLNSILFCGTGALHSPVSGNQGSSIPAICHAVRLERA